MLLSLALLACQSPVALPPSPETAAPQLARIAVVGASASRGFGLSLELEVDCSLSPFLDAALTLAHEELLNLSDGMMFSDPSSKGAEQLEEASAFAPSLLIAADFPFWFGYGGWNSSLEQRLARLDRGLQLEAAEHLLGGRPTEVIFRPADHRPVPEPAVLFVQRREDPAR